MNTRKDIDWGRDLTPEEIWDAWKREVRAGLARALGDRVRKDSLPEKEAAPG